ncbi:hypothetical protein AAG906_024698 [Vitis piasezkii]
MVEAAQDDCKANPKLFERLLEDAEKPLYPGCKNFTKLSALVKLYNLKGRYGWSDKSFSELLSLLGDMLLNELKDASSCPTCGASRWKVNRRGSKRVKDPQNCKNLIWYAKVENLMENRHPSDSPSWKTCHFSDDINPHSSLSRYSCWPIVMITYNLPPWLCMKRKFMMLSLLISGLYIKGCSIMDINDFPAYGNLSGCIVKGYFACPICGPETYSHRLKHGRKNSFTSHRRFLPCNHPFRKHRKAFNGEQEFRSPPQPLSGEEILLKMNAICNSWGKREDMKIQCDLYQLLEEKSIFFELEYWRYLHVRHNLDVMHIEKNVCESIIGTLLNILWKTKDGLNSRLDLMDMGLRCELAPRFESNRTYLPPACYTLSRKEKKVFCQTLAELKVPEGYCSNFRNLVSMEDLKLYGLKSHDYHTLMQQLLPVALRSLLPKHVRHAIARLSLFFNALCKKVVDVSTLDKLQNELVVTLCLLEKYFSPSFDIMIHLTVHLVREVRLCGPIYFRWMYPFERFMEVLKGYVKPSTNVDHKVGAPIPGGHITEVDCNLLLQAHHYVLENTTIIQPYIEEHMKWLKLNNPRQSKRQKWLQKNTCEHSLIGCEKALIIKILITMVHSNSRSCHCDKEPISETLRWMAHGPTHYVAKYHGYVINGCQYNTKDRDELRVTQNSGVSIVATTMQISSAKDKNPVFGELCFYGIITEIWDLDYTMFRIPVFKCNWVDNKSGIKVDEFGLTLVDFTKMAHKSDPFILASQAKQVFYVQDQLDPRWSVVLSTPERDFSFSAKDSDDFMDNSIEHHPLITTLAQVESFDTMDDSDVICIRGDCEGFWIDNKSSM